MECFFRGQRGRLLPGGWKKGGEGGSASFSVGEEKAMDMGSAGWKEKKKEYPQEENSLHLPHALNGGSNLGKTRTYRLPVYTHAEDGTWWTCCLSRQPQAWLLVQQHDR